MAKSALITIVAGSSICSELQIYQIIGGNPFLLASDVDKSALEGGYLLTGVDDNATGFRVVDECVDSPCQWTYVDLVCSTTTTEAVEETTTTTTE